MPKMRDFIILQTKMNLKTVKSQGLWFTEKALQEKKRVIAVSTKDVVCFDADDEELDDDDDKIQVVKNWVAHSTTLNSELAQKITLRDDYYIPAMAGQTGVVAISAIAKGSIVAEYGGLFMTPREFNQFSGTQLEEEVRKYTVEVDVDVNLYLCGHYDANQVASYINDWRVDPFELRESKVNKHHKDKENIMMDFVLVNGFPRVMMFATRDIHPGEPLLMDYGNGYFYCIQATQKEGRRRRHRENEARKFVFAFLNSPEWVKL